MAGCFPSFAKVFPILGWRFRAGSLARLSQACDFTGEQRGILEEETHREQNPGQACDEIPAQGWLAGFADLGT